VDRNHVPDRLRRDRRAAGRSTVFVSEFLLFYAGYLGLVQSTVNIAAAGLISLVAMGLISRTGRRVFRQGLRRRVLGVARSHEVKA